ncbi:MFS transporter [Eubacterium callanderi]|uniref:Purine efflux pump PbuE n=1 Tax=Eubacterium limosum TaxID=1736 RepID=A0A6N3G1H6_EUBLI
MKKNFIFVLTIGVFSILNTEMGIVGILPAISEQYGVSLTTAGMLVSLFALAIAIAGPVMPMLMSRFERKKVMIFVLCLFTAGNIAAAFAVNFQMLLVARVIPAFFHPVYVSFALAAASDSVENQADVPKAVSKVMVGVSAGMVLGAPVAGLIVNSSTLRIGLLFFAAVNLISLIATVLFVPEFAASEKVSYGQQLRVLKEKRLWLALVGVLLLNGSIFGVYSYVSAYLEEVMNLPVQIISIVLFAYGLMNIVGNTVAGRGLSSMPNQFISIQPIVIGVIYLLLLFLAGKAMIPALAVILAWGVSAGAVANTIQYWVTTAAPGAAEFANGLYLTAANLGISAATPFCGVFITRFGTQAAPVGGILLVILSAVCILLKVHVMDKKKKELQQ